LLRLGQKERLHKMKKLVLITWFAMVVASPLIEDFASMAQLELAFLIWGLWYFNKSMSKKVFSNILIIFGTYYSYIFITDQFITNMPYIAVLIESFVFIIILMVYSDE